MASVPGSAAAAPPVSQAFQLAARAIIAGGEGDTPAVGRAREGVIKGLELLNSTCDVYCTQELICDSHLSLII